MPLRNKRKQNKKYLVWAIIILIVVLMIVSIPNKPEFTEVVLFP